MDMLIRKSQELSAIVQVSQVLTRSFDLERNLHDALETLASSLDMQRGCVFVLDRASQELRIVSAYGLTREEIQRATYRIGEGIVGRVIESGQPMFVPNIGLEPKFLNKTDCRPRKSGVSFLCMPIELDGQVFGVISVDRIYTEERGNVDDDLRVLSIVSSLMAQFVVLWEHFTKTERECGNLRLQLKEKYSLSNVIGESPAFQQVLKAVLKVAATDTTVLLLGESGTGKELVAQTLHYQSRRSRRNFVPVNLAALPENLVEAELFGVEKGAFTGATARRIGRFELADQGTIFLDEIGELPLTMQAKLLRVLQEKCFERIGSSQSITVNARVVAATNRDLRGEVSAGRFREDLYWRLNVVPIVMPPLRNRTEDIPLLLDNFMTKFNHAHGRNVRLHPAVVENLKHYSWPGNVRELANMVERLVVMSDKELVGLEELPATITSHRDSRPALRANACACQNLGNEIEHLERNHIIQAMRQSNGVQQKASRTLGITPRQLGYRIRKYGIDLREFG